MNDETKTKKELIRELQQIREQVARLKKSEQGREEIKEKYRESDNRYRVMFDNMRDGVAIYKALHDGDDFIFVDFNKAAEEIENIKRRDLIGKSVLQVFPGVKEFGLFEVFQRVWETGKAEHYPVRMYKDKRITGWRENYIYKLPPDEIVSIYSDSTKQNQAEGELKLRAEMLNQAIDGIMLRDFNGNLLYANETAIKERGYTLEEFFKLNTWDLVVIEPDAEKIEEWWQEIMEKGYRHAEYNIRRKDGSLVPMDVMATKIKSGDKEYVLSVTRNISEQKRMEAEREEMERKAQVASRLASVGEMASGIAHEINNPLTGVVGFTQLLTDREDLSEDVREQLKIIHDGGQRVSNIIKGLLSFARQSKPKREYVDINEVLEGTLRLSHYELETGNIEVIKKFDPELPWTMADAGQLQQVFINLVVNAQQEMRRAHGKGRLEIKTELAGDMIHISLKDDGPGIAKENIEKIFDPFFTTKEFGKGTGLGLSLSHGIIAEHGGQLYAESEPGEGTTFVVELPVLVEEVEIEEAKIVDKTSEVIKGRILVVDDEEVVRQYLNSVLSKMGDVVDMATDGEEALKLVKSIRYNLILCDMKMPGMDGKEFYRRIKEIASSLSKRVVFITGDVMGEDTQDFIRKTGAQYITKPFDAERLRGVVNNMLGGLKK